MRTIHRAYDDNLGDFRAVARFFIQHAAHLRTHSTWALSRYVDWRYGLYESRTDRPGFWENNARRLSLPLRRDTRQTALL